PGTSTASVGRPPVLLPPVNQPWDYQLGAAYRPAAGVTVITRDHAQPPVPGAYNICYVNAFQTQPGESGRWPATLLLRDATGQPVEDPARPGEYLLDTRTAARQSAITARLQEWLADCAREGYQAVEPDNLDSWTRSGGLLRAEDNLAVAARLVSAAHSLGLAVAQKNAAELLPRARAAAGFDFAVVEDCQVFAGCGTFLAAYGNRVLELEYADHGSAGFAAACRDHGTQVSITSRDRRLTTPGRPGYVFRTC
ncbi:MAG TPA: endo alpha-1,4 polygalactosaminidase, partial [Kineosporiaceae bacterium]|nr:endo alpha-1,4 polygalactosaminidase [Kineosporiaceae bacterium]